MYLVRVLLLNTSCVCLDSLCGTGEVLGEPEF